MFGSSTIDIAIGLVFVFLLLSLLVSTINEMIQSLSSMRGRDLLRGIKTLLDDNAATGLVKEIYNHGQIFGLFEGDFDPKKKGNLPSYIPSKNFALALLDVVCEPGKDLKDGAKSFTAATTTKVATPLLSMIKVAGDDTAKLTKSVEDWYNSAMDRVSGWYKYRTQWFLFWIGLTFAIAINADAISILKQLSGDSTIRQSIVAVAQSAKQPNTQTGQALKQQIDDLHTQLKNFDDLGIRFGWKREELPKAFSLGALWGVLSPYPVEFAFRILGWFLTAIAVSLGAPFWFDILNKIMVVRSTVKPREKSHEEESKDK